jgi:hypothetical protein
MVESYQGIRPPYDHYILKYLDLEENLRLASKAIGGSAILGA